MQTISSQRKKVQLLKILKKQSVNSTKNAISDSSKPMSVYIEENKITAQAYYQSGCALEDEYKIRSHELLNNQNERKRIIDGVICCYTEAIKLSPDYYEAYYARGNFLLIINEQHQHARKDFEKTKESSLFLKRANEKLETLQNRVDRKWSEAKRIFQTERNLNLTNQFVIECEDYIRSCPTSYEASYLLAESLLAYYWAIHFDGESDDILIPGEQDIENDYSKIIQHFEYYISHNPSNSAAHFNIGKFYWYFKAASSLEHFLIEEKNNLAWKLAIHHLTESLKKNPSPNTINSIFTMLTNLEPKELSQKEINAILLLTDEIKQFSKFFSHNQKTKICILMANLYKLKGELKIAKGFWKRYESMTSNEKDNLLLSCELHNINYQFYIHEYNSISREYGVKNSELSIFEENCALWLNQYSRDRKFLPIVSMKLIDFCWKLACFYTINCDFPRADTLFEKIIHIYDFENITLTNNNQHVIFCTALYKTAYHYNNNHNTVLALKFFERIIDMLEKAKNTPDLPGRDDQPELKRIAKKAQEFLDSEQYASAEKSKISDRVNANISSKEIPQEILSEEKASQLETLVVASSLTETTTKSGEPEQSKKIEQSNQKRKVKKQKRKEAAAHEKQRQLDEKLKEEAAQKMCRNAADEDCRNVEEIFSKTIDKNDLLPRDKTTRAQNYLNAAKTKDPAYGRVDFLFAKLYFYKEYLILLENSDYELDKCAEKIRLLLLRAIQSDNVFESMIDAYILLINLELKSCQKDISRKYYTELSDIGRQSEYSESQRVHLNKLKNILFPEIKEKAPETQNTEEKNSEKVISRKINKNLTPPLKIKIKESLTSDVINNEQITEEQKNTIDPINPIKNDLEKRLSFLVRNLLKKPNLKTINDFTSSADQIINKTQDFFNGYLLVSELLLNYLIEVTFSKLSMHEFVHKNNQHDIKNYIPIILHYFELARQINNDDIRIHYGLWRLYWNISLLPISGEMLDPEIIQNAWKNAIKHCCKALKLHPNASCLEEIMTQFSLTDGNHVQNNDILSVLEQAIKCPNFLAIKKTNSINAYQNRIFRVYAASYEKTNTRKALDQHWKTWLFSENTSSALKQLISQHIVERRLKFYSDLYRITDHHAKAIKSSFDLNEKQAYDIYVRQYNHWVDKSPDNKTLHIASLLLKDMFQLLGNIFLRIGNHTLGLELFEKIIETHDFLDFNVYTADEIRKYITALRACIVTRILVCKEDVLAKHYAEKIIIIYTTTRSKFGFSDQTISAEGIAEIEKIFVEANLFVNSNSWSNIANTQPISNNKMDDLDIALQDMMKKREHVKVSDSSVFNSTILTDNRATLFSSEESFFANPAETDVLKISSEFMDPHSYTFNPGSSKKC